jgi:uncharacterized repeat protein (TIGR03806 family)
MAFHPNFSSNRYVYIFYSHAGTPRVSYVSRFTASADGATIDPNSELVLITVQKPYDNHNGGNLVFGPDGYLYVGFGDGGSGDDPNNFAQNLKTLFGKIIRIDVDHPQDGKNYGIPADNPFTGGAKCSAVVPTALSPTSCPEIYAYGLRNPWRWSFDSSDLWVGDVGQNTYEEVDRVTKGGNYGWRCREGMHPNPDGIDLSSCPAASTLIDPVAEYNHSQGDVAITGGYVYRGSAIPGLAGKYIFGDEASGRLWALTSNAQGGWDRSDLAQTGKNISSFARDANNELYLVSYSDGFIYSIQTGSGASGGVATMLSQTGCVATNATQPASGLIPYKPVISFWSDGAAKDRWMAVPDAQKITVASDGDFTFPNGSVLVKNFSLNNQLVETRLFMRHPDGVWAGYSYEWNSAQTDATLVSSAGKSKMIGALTWIYPSQAQCLQCHTAAAGYTLGLETRQLNSDLLYPSTNRTANQMATLDHIAMFTASPPTMTAYPDLAGTDTLANRARAYLHENCAGCHRPGSASTTSNMDLRYSTALSATNACNATPQSGDLGIAGAKIITPGSAATSVMPARMNRRDGNGMPPVASSIADATGVQLITDWINSLNSASCN